MNDVSRSVPLFPRGCQPFHRKVRVRPKLAPLAPFHVSAEITSNAFRRSVNVLLAKNADG